MKRDYSIYKYFKGERRNPFCFGDVRRDFWYGERKHSSQFVGEFPPKDIAAFIRDFFRRRRPFDSLEWVCQY